MRKEPFIKKLTRNLNLHNVAIAIGVAMALFHLYTGVFGCLPAQQQRATHLLFVLFLVFLIYPARRGIDKKRLPFYDWVLILLAIVSTGYIVFNYEYIAFGRIYYVTPLLPIEKVLAITTIILILEAARRTVGLFLTGVATFFLIYVFI